MLKQHTIILFTLLLFSILNFAPYYMVNCTETNGSAHLENIFNRCCNSSMAQKNKMSMEHTGVFFGMNHCKCSVEISGGEYIIPNIDKSISYKVLITDNSDSNEHTKQEKFIPTYTTESPPISINLVRTSVLLI